jgi:hypothetical protein
MPRRSGLEDVIECQLRDGKWEYVVSWVGNYGPTWELLSVIRKEPQMLEAIRKFHEHPETSKPTMRVIRVTTECAIKTWF